MDSSANTSSNKSRKPRRLYAKIWLGGNTFGWGRMLAHNCFAIGPRGLHSLVFITFATSVNTLLWGLEELIWGRRVRNTDIKPAPLFLIGHWRTGTTWLHELLVLDDQYTYPTTYQCFNPNHFLLTEWIDMHWLRFFFDLLLPSHRPFDNMALEWEHPQEDEFALCNLGLPSPYQKLAFPNHNPYPEYFDLEGVPPQELQRWKAVFLRFLKELTVRDPKRIILKSPIHTYRIKLLLDLFPDAQFVHIVRDPYVVFLSTMHMWRSIYEAQGLHRPKFEGLEGYVFENFIHMFKKLDEARPLLSASQFHELRYEDLVQDPIGQLRVLYEKLNLGDFEQVVPRLEQHLKETADYQTNRYDKLSPELRDQITERWGQVIERYGYASAASSSEGCVSATLGAMRIL